MSPSRSIRLALPILFAGALAACGSGAGEEDAPVDAVEGSDTVPASVEAPRVEDGVVIVTPERVRQWQLEGEPFVLIDARDAVQYRQEHLPEAVNVSYVDIRAGADLPPRDATVVVYCSDEDCPISQYAYEALAEIGYTDLYDMRAGIQGWKAAGYPTEIGEGDAAAPDEGNAPTAGPDVAPDTTPAGT